MGLNVGPFPRPTKVRYVVLALTTMVAVLLYLDRICLGFAERYIKDDLNLTDAEMSVIVQSFFWAYAIGQLPAGWLSDRFGARLMLAIFLAGWSAMTGWLGFAYTMAAIVVLRFGCGLLEAGAYPACAGLIRRWMPFERRGLASGIVSIGGRLGGAVAPILTAFLMVAFVPASIPSRLEPSDLKDRDALLKRLKKADNASAEWLNAQVVGQYSAFNHTAIVATDPALDLGLIEALNDLVGRADLKDHVDPRDFDLPAHHFPATPNQDQIERANRLLLEAAYPESIRKIQRAGWRPAMMVYGILGLVVAAVFFLLFRDSPRQHPGCNSAEVSLIDGHDPAPAPGVRAPFDFRLLLVSPSLWWISLVQFLTNFAWVFLITWFPRFLQEEFRVPIVERGLMTSLPILIGIVGMFAGGWLTDAMVQRLGRRWGRSLPLALSRFVVAAGFLLCMMLGAPWPVTISFCLVALATDLGTPSVWAYSLDTGGKNVGAVLGWSNMFGNIGAAVGTGLQDIIVRHHGWGTMFMTCAVVMILSGIASLLVDATKPITPEKAGS